MRQRSRACVPLLAMTPSLMRPASILSERNRSSVSSKPLCASLDETSSSTYHGKTRRQRIDDPADMLQRHVDAEARDQLEGGELIAARLARAREQLHRVFDARQAEERGLDGFRQREKAQGRGGDDAERAFAADEELLHVVAGIVLAQRAQAVPHAAIGQHDFEAEHQRARIAVAQHLDTAGIGRDIAADLARAFGAEAQGEEAIDAPPPPSAPRRG